jgi:hypothetical protein
MGAVAASVRRLPPDALLRYEEEGRLQVAGAELRPGDIKVGG